MQEQLINFETAKLAKEKGFNVNEKYNNYTHSEFYYENSHILKPLIIHGCRTTGSLSLFENIYDAPTQSLLQKWLREIYNIDILPFVHISDGKYYTVSINESQKDKRPNQYNLSEERYIKTFKTYEEALEEGLQEGLKLIK